VLRRWGAPPGGGFAVNYRNPRQALPLTEHAKALLPLLKDKPYRIALEPGRYIVRTELAGFSAVERKDVPVRTALWIAVAGNNYAFG